jgi:hypothetical protein
VTCGQRVMMFAPAQTTAAMSLAAAARPPPPPPPPPLLLLLLRRRRRRRRQCGIGGSSECSPCASPCRCTAGEGHDVHTFMRRACRELPTGLVKTSDGHSLQLALLRFRPSSTHSMAEAPKERKTFKKFM